MTLDELRISLKSEKSAGASFSDLMDEIFSSYFDPSDSGDDDDEPPEQLSMNFEEPQPKPIDEQTLVRLQCGLYVVKHITENFDVIDGFGREAVMRLCEQEGIDPSFLDF